LRFLGELQWYSRCACKAIEDEMTTFFEQQHSARRNTHFEHAALAV